MAPALGQGESTLTWSGRAVDIERIESELLGLRYEAAGGTEGDDTFAIRTSLFNLVVHAADGRAAREAGQVIAALPSHHASRAIIAVTKPSEARSRIDANLAAHCHLSPGLQQQVCCEEITLRLTGRVAYHPHSIIVPLLVSDLPVYVWWTGELAHNAHILEEMMGNADRFIADSARFSRSGDGLGRLAQLCRERPNCGVGDLNWSRLTPWRQALAQYGQMPDMRRRLEPITAVEIGFTKGGRQRPPSQALLLLGWLAARLGWETGQPSRPGSGGGFTMLSGRHRVSVNVRPREGCPGMKPGSVSAVRLQGRQRDRASLSITMVDDPLHLTLRREGDQEVRQERVRIEPCGEGEMLARELAAQGQDSEYEEALRRAVALEAVGKR